MSRLTVRDGDILHNGGLFIPYGINCPIHRYQPGDMALIKSLNANTVRITVLWGVIPYNPQNDAYESTAPGAFSPTILATLWDAIKEARNNGLIIDLAISGGEGDFFTNSKKQTDFARTWALLAHTFRDYVDLYEILTEPSKPCGNLYTNIFGMIRAMDPTAVAVVGPQGYSVLAFRSLFPLDMSNMVYTFDFYVPQAYVHQLQGRGYAPSTYPGNFVGKNGKQQINNRDYLDGLYQNAEKFRLTHKVPIWCNQVGVPWATLDAAAWAKDALSILAPTGMCWWTLRVGYDGGASIPEPGTTGNSLGDMGFYGQDNKGNWSINLELNSLWLQAITGH